MRTFAFLKLISLVAPSIAYAARLDVLIVPDARPEAMRCAQALEQSKAIIAEDGLSETLKIIPSEQYDAVEKASDLNWRSRSAPQIVMRLDQGAAPAELQAVPFAFRDAAHFMAFLQSPLSRRFEIRSGHAALAYGGFSQLFSRKAAITQPQHLFGRMVSGDPAAMVVYHELGAKVGAYSLGFYLANLPDAFRNMGTGSPRYDIVEASLSGALAGHAELSARYLSLTSASLTTVAFRLLDGEDIIRPARLRAWAKAAALTCSRTNYDAELSALERFKQSGIQVAPFNRPALVETSWKVSLGMPHGMWTLSDFEELEHLSGSSDGASPTAAMAKLSPKKRADALRYNREATDFATDKDGQVLEERKVARFDAVWEESNREYRAAITKLDLPLPNARSDRPKPMSSASPGYLEASRLIPKLEEEIRQCAKCLPPESWAFLARIHTSMGDEVAARKAMDESFAKADPVRNKYLYRRLLRNAAAIEDERAKAAVQDLLRRVKAAAQSGGKDGFPFDDAILTAYMLADLDRGPEAKDVVKILAEFAAGWGNKESFERLANVQWYVGDTGGARASILEAVIRAGGPPSWPPTGGGPRAHATLNLLFAKPAAENFERVSTALRNLMPDSLPEERELLSRWSSYLVQAGKIECEFDMKAQAERNRQTIIEAAKADSVNRKDLNDDAEEIYSFCRSHAALSLSPAYQKFDDAVKGLERATALDFSL